MRSVFPYIGAMLLIHSFGSVALYLWIASASRVRKKARRMAKQASAPWERFTRFYLLRASVKNKVTVRRLLYARLIWFGYGAVLVLILASVFDSVPSITFDIIFSIFQRINLALLIIFLLCNHDTWKYPKQHQVTISKLILKRFRGRKNSSRD